MPEIINTEQRFVDAWWSEKIAERIKDLPHTAASAFPDADIGKDFRGTLDRAIEKAGLKEKLVETSSFHHTTDNEVNGAGAVFLLKDEKESGIVASMTVLIVEVYSDVILARTWGHDMDECKKICKDVISQVPRRDKPVPREDLIPTAFWHSGPGGEGACYIKDIQCPAFDEFKENYGREVQKQIKWLMNLEQPDELGKIILWHGPPGMGKTYAVRALARAWSNELDATVEVVLDPELMLASAGYMRSIILSEERAARARRSIKTRKSGKSKGDERPLRLIIVEDSAELFSEGCRNTAGFSRLLNLTDGLIGQGLRCIFLLTANEEIGKIDPAVRRAGRCIQTLYFPQLDRDEADKWLKTHKVKPKEKLEYPISLAELYSIKNGKKEEEPAEAGSKFGFGS